MDYYQIQRFTHKLLLPNLVNEITTLKKTQFFLSNSKNMNPILLRSETQEFSSVLICKLQAKKSLIPS